MHAEVDNLLPDLKSEKPIIRQKAFSKLLYMLFNRLSEMQEMIDDDNSTLTWEDIFRATHHGVFHHAHKLHEKDTELQENDLKITNYSNVLVKLSSSPANESTGISFNYLMTVACSVLKDDALLRYFGKHYLQILQSTVLKKGNNLTTVKLNLWKELLEVLFKLLKSHRHVIAFNDIVSCASLTVELGCSFSHLATDISEYLPKLTHLLNKRTVEREKLELLFLAYHCTINIAVDSRLAVCKFTETIGKFIHEVFKVELPEESKEILFRLMDLSLIVHHPLLANDKTMLEFVGDKDAWHSQLRNYVYILELEMKLPPKSRFRVSKKNETNQMLAQFAARLCFLMRWDDSAWLEKEEDSENVAKRLKRANKLQSLMDLTQPSMDPADFNWNWLTVIAEVISNHPTALEDDNFQALLQLLSECQTSMEYDYQVYVFTKCCFALLQRDEKFAVNANTIIANHCRDLWHKIADGAMRVCTLNNKHSIECHILLQTLIHHQKFPSSSFIEELIKIFLTKETIKSDATLNTLVTIMKSFNLELMPNGKELATKILAYTFEKPTLADLKKTITTAGKEKPSARVLAEIGVICCLSKGDIVNFTKHEALDTEQLFEGNWNLEKQKAYKKQVNDILQLILLNCNELLLIEDVDFIKSQECGAVDGKKSEFPLESKCIIDDKACEELLRFTELKRKVIGEEQAIDDIKDYLISVLENNEIMMNITNQFLRFEAFNKDRFASFFTMKKIEFHLQEIDRLFELILSKRTDTDDLDMRDTHRLLTLVRSLFRADYHREICVKIRTFELRSCLRWVSRQVDHTFITQDGDDKEMEIGWDEFVNAKMEHKIKFLAIEALIEYNNFEGVNTEFMVDRLRQIELDEGNMDLHVVFHIIKQMRQQQSVPEEMVDWIWRSIVAICRFHHTNQYLSAHMIRSLKDIVYLSRGHFNMTSNVISLYTSFGKICMRPEYKPEVTIEFLHQFKFFHQEHVKLTADEQPVIEIYDSLIENFLTSDLIGIKMAAIKTIAFILHVNIEKTELREARAMRKKIFKNIIEKYSIRLQQTDMETDTEKDANDDAEVKKISSNLQLFSSILCANYISRNQMLWELTKVCIRHQISADAAKQMFAKFLTFLKCDHRSLMNSNAVLHIVTKLLNENLRFMLFPWYFTNSSSVEGFLNEDYGLVILAYMRNRSREVDKFCKDCELSPKDEIMGILPSCFAFTLPVEAGCNNIPYENDAEEMKKKLDGMYKKFELSSALLQNSPTIIGTWLQNFHDKAKFKEICDFDIELHEVTKINWANFNKCLEVLRKYFKMPPKQSVITFFASNQKFHNFVEKLLRMSKKNVQETSLKEQKLLHLLQYWVLVEKFFDYLNDNTINEDMSIKAFIVKNISYFLCFLLEDENYGQQLRTTAAIIFLKFLKQILPNCAAEVIPILNKIVSSLVTICKTTEAESELTSTCFSIIQFLVFDSQEILESEIANLDNFPDGEKFKVIREKQLEIKYKDGTYTLAQEIEHFLANKKRKVEGLRALREHLANKKIELKGLYDELQQTLGFTEDGENSLLHKLIRMLVNYARNAATDEERAVEAIKCLGEIGNYNLSTMVFTTENHEKITIYNRIESTEDLQEKICNVAFEQMEIMILHQNVRVFEVASATCYHMMESISAKGFKSSALLRPFNSDASTNKLLFYLAPKESKTLDLMATLKNEEYSSYKTWIKRLSGSMMRFAGNKYLEEVSSVQKTFAEIMNPLMLQLLISYDHEKLNDDIIQGVNYFFDECATKLNHTRANEGSIFLDKLAIKQMLKLAECIRSHCQDNRKSKMAQNLNLNYLHIAKAAKFCEAFFTAVLYCEKWAEQRLINESVTFATSLNNKTLQEIMYEAFESIGIKDASELFVNPTTKRPLYLQACDQNWQNLLELESARSEDEMEKKIKLLKDMGLYYLSLKLTESSKNHKMQYECLWRLCNWDALVDKDSGAKDGKVNYQDEFEKFHYSGLQCLKLGDELGVKNAVLKARQSVLQLIQEESLECTQNLYKFLGKSHLLQQIEDFSQLRFRRITSHEDLLQKWDFQNQLPNDFKLIEPILSQRNSILDTANIKMGKRIWVPGAVQSNMLYIVTESIQANCSNEAIKTIAEMKVLMNLTPTAEAEMLIKEAQLNFKTNMRLAKHSLNRVMEDDSFKSEHLLRSIAFRMFGQILAESHAAEIEEINTNYFSKSIKQLEKYAKHHHKDHLVNDVTASEMSQGYSQPVPVEEDEDLLDKKIRKNICVFDIVAKYFDREYVSKCEYIASPDFVNKQKTYESNKKTVIQLTAMYNADKRNKELYKSLIIFQRSMEIDAKEIESTENQKKAAAGKAVYFYLRGAMNDSSDNVLSIFRTISIWLANPDNTTIYKMLHESLQKIPSYKFVVALPQLVVRLTADDFDLQNKILRKLLRRCAVDHPHHTLPLILSLVNSYADTKLERNHQDEPRVVGAKKLWNSFKKTKEISQQMIKGIEAMSSALIELANDNDANANTQKLRSLDNLCHVQCPTVELPVMKDCKYGHAITTIVRWRTKIDSPGGINAPKKIACVCSDGIVRSQLLKGKDDMRQDAVMQQVFNVVNQLLRSDKEMSNRHASIRTYKVVPLSRRSGILEWCNNTIPIGMYLAPNKNGSNSKGAHERYYPEDWTPQQCFIEVGKADKVKDEATLDKMFTNVCSHIRPAFHHFFYENYKEPGKLFERRLAYTTSVAVSSIVGYILGIGDRHVQNILIDYLTAEVIHIDFGIAFEQGKILPHKELIPFRLTRDIVAPMGVCGVDGVFRKTCEKTLEILRENYSTITTILEVLLYDPMYAWTVSSKEAQRHQEYEVGDDDSGDGPDQVQRDAMASRALLRVQAKLKGQADGSTGYSSVEGHVESLINQARNITFLSQLFRGWQAYL